jgi:hypothetical protein
MTLEEIIGGARMVFFLKSLCLIERRLSIDCRKMSRRALQL